MFTTIIQIILNPTLQRLHLGSRHTAPSARRSVDAICLADPHPGNAGQYPAHGHTLPGSNQLGSVECGVFDCNGCNQLVATLWLYQDGDPSDRELDTPCTGSGHSRIHAASGSGTVAGTCRDSIAYICLAMLYSFHESRSLPQVSSSPSLFSHVVASLAGWQGNADSMIP